MREFRSFCNDFEKKAEEGKMEKEALSPALLQGASDKAKFRGWQEGLVAKMDKMQNYDSGAAGRAKALNERAEKFRIAARKKEALRKTLGAPIHRPGEGYVGSLARSGKRGVESIRGGLADMGASAKKGLKSMAKSLARRARMFI